ncbi:hypothetical protein L6R52_43135, partial [Myxococcota bacterium]|nr:hypothetical protein [Myxococcota bacterium]
MRRRPPERRRDPLDDPRAERLVVREATGALSPLERDELEACSARDPAVLRAREAEAHLTRLVAEAARPADGPSLDVARLARV